MKKVIAFLVIMSAFFRDTRDTLITQFQNALDQFKQEGAVKTTNAGYVL